MRIKCLIIIICILTLTKAANACNQPFKKLGRGIINIATSPVEIPRQARDYWIQGAEKTFHISFWVFSGLIKGIVFNMPARLGSGLWDVATFPIAYPKDYRSVINPEYVFQNWPRMKEGVDYKFPF